MNANFSKYMLTELINWEIKGNFNVWTVVEKN